MSTPNLDLDEMDQNDDTQGSRNRYSQLSPIDIDFMPSSSQRGRGLPFDYDFSGGSQNRFATPIGMGGHASQLPSQKTTHEEGVDLFLGDEEPLMPLDSDFDFKFDAEGNLIGKGGEELPPLAGSDNLPEIEVQDGQQQHFSQHVPGQQGEMMVFEEALPEVEGEQTSQQYDKQPGSVERTKQTKEEVMGNQERSKEEAATAPHRRRGPQPRYFVDEVSQHTTAELRAWNNTYAERQRPNVANRAHTSLAKARKNAYHFIFGLGLHNVGASTGFPSARNPLAEFYSGNALSNAIIGVFTQDPREHEPEIGRGRSRSAEEAFGEDEDEGRRVRQKTDHGKGPGLTQEEGVTIPEEEILPEIGMERPTPLPEHPSSANMPWSRAGSVPPSAKSHRTRGESQLISDPRHPGSDIPHPPSDGINLPSDDLGGFNPLHSQHSSMVDPNLDQHKDSQFLRDQESDEFLGYVAQEGCRSGILDGDKMWVDFEKVAVPGKNSREVAARAFYHTLVLATKDRIAVRQEDGGGIFMGVMADDMEAAKDKAREEPPHQLHGRDDHHHHDGEEAEREKQVTPMEMEMEDIGVRSSEMNPVVHHVEYNPVEDDAVVENVDSSSEGYDDEEMDDLALE